MKKTIKAMLMIAVSLFLWACEDDPPDDPAMRHYKTNSIFVLDNDVYVTGWYHPTGTSDQVSCYWVNGKLVDTYFENDAMKIAAAYGNTKKFSFNGTWKYSVSGSDLYKLNNDKCFKNNREIEVNFDGHEFSEIRYFLYTALFVDGDDVYIAGNVYGTYPDGEKDKLSFVWKNGESEYSGHDSYYSFFVNGADVHGVNMHGIYHNNVLVDGTYNTGTTYGSIYVDNGNVYVLGYTGSTMIGDKEKRDYCLWINNEPTELQSEPDEVITSVFVNNGDIYLSSSYPNGGCYEYHEGSMIYYTMPCYYKNGERIDLN
ncbi:MAG TPA: hypothetical protein PK573_07690 [Spirochaetota bacterium]|nr:hypothetical protein [Spirochaetota bacterium]HRZ27298.1 hypothetical protein [Spirochaetota bacterium]HSA14392.1 hypothetical protein [Spirochaetota bacterium]